MYQPTDPRIDPTAYALSETAPPIIWPRPGAADAPTTKSASVHLVSRRNPTPRPRRTHYPRSRPENRPARPSRRPAPSAPPLIPVRVADLFAGIGGFHLAFERVGGQVVFAAEFDKHARQTYEANFRPSNPELFESGNFAGDITKVDAASIPDFDVVTGGFPCQPFSMAGKRRGFDDSRGTLFFDIARIIQAKQPGGFLLENVQGLLSHDEGRTFKTIQHIITEELGYSLHHKVIRACDFGLPQLRPRLFMVGFRDTATPFVWPEPIPLEFTLSDLFDGQANREISYTILTGHRGKPFGSSRAWDAYLVDGEVRRLGVAECRTLQGFPADFILPSSVTQAHKQLGNAVAIPAAEAVARQVIASLRTCPTLLLPPRHEVHREPGRPPSVADLPQ